MKLGLPRQRMYKEQENSPLEWSDHTETLETFFLEKICRLATMKSCSTSLIIREMQIKATMNYHLTCMGGYYQKIKDKC